MIRITAPEPVQGTVTFLDVDFFDGVAEVEALHPERALALTLHGYTLSEHAAEIPVDETGTVVVDLEDLTIAELRDLAGDRATIPARASKAEAVAIVAALSEEKPADQAQDGEVHPTPTVVTDGVTSLLSEAGAAGAHTDDTED